MDAKGFTERISRDRNRERYMERHFNILRMLPPGKNFWIGNSYSCTYTVLLTVMCLQTGCFPWTICEKRLLDEYRQLGEDIESGGSSLRCRMNLRGKRYKIRSKVWFVIWSLKSSRKKPLCGLLSNFFHCRKIHKSRIITYRIKLPFTLIVDQAEGNKAKPTPNQFLNNFTISCRSL